jgi:hypothetical protein
MCELDFAERLTDLGRKALKVMSPDLVALGMMTAALNVCLELLPHPEVAAWLRRLADTIDEYDPSAPSRFH